VIEGWATPLLTLILGLTWFAWAQPRSYRKLFLLVVPPLFLLAAALWGAMVGFRLGRSSEYEVLEIGGIEAQTVFYGIMAFTFVWSLLLYARFFKDD